MSSIVPIQTNACGYCGGFHSGTCPRVKSITYHQNGTVSAEHPAAQDRECVR